MKILILGAGGMIGQKLIHHLAKKLRLSGRDISEVLLVDAFINPSTPQESLFPIHTQIADITDPQVCYIS